MTAFRLVMRSGSTSPMTNSQAEGTNQIRYCKELGDSNSWILIADLRRECGRYSLCYTYYRILATIRILCGGCVLYFDHLSNM